MSARHPLLRLAPGLVLALVAALSGDLVSASADSTPPPGLQCGRAVGQWNGVTVDDLALTLQSVRRSPAPSSDASPAADGVVLVEVTVENKRAQPVTLNASQFILTDCRNDSAPALSCALGPTVQPLAFSTDVDQQATSIARANAAACQTLPMLIDRRVPAHGRLQGWIAFPSWLGAQPRSFDYLVIDAGTLIESTAHCRLVETSAPAAAPSSGETTACTAAAPVATSLAPLD